MKYALHLLLVRGGTFVLRQPLHAQGCPHLFTANGQSNSSYIQYCVSDNGNIVSLISPFNRPQILQFPGFPASEGYGLCQESPTIEYHDYYTDASPNWEPARILRSSGGSIEISRTTADGNWTLLQTISRVAPTGSIKLVMTLTNNQSIDRVAYLLRVAQPWALAASSPRRFRRADQRPPSSTEQSLCRRLNSAAKRDNLDATPIR